MRLFPLHQRRRWLDRLLGYLAELGPYLTIELLLPGGSLIALLLWLHRRNHHR